MSLALTKNSFAGKRNGPVVVIVMDGYGIGLDYPGNAINAAKKPVLDQLFATCPNTTLRAHGTAVGLPDDSDMGNSEVGHNALGAGRVFAQGAKLVNNAIESGSIFADKPWQEVVGNVKDSGCLHFIGLFSDGNVHSHIDQLKAMIARAKADGVGKVAVHALIDGRDVGETSALEYTEPFEAWLAELDPNYGIASGGGRMNITMDRYGADWTMVERGWKAHVLAEGPQFASASEAVKGLREQNPGVIDQDLPAFIVARDGKPFAPIVDGDSVVFFNFRGDRAIEISQAFTQDDVPFARPNGRPDVCFAGMMQYDGDAKIPERYLVAPPSIDRTMGEYLAVNGVSQFACSETQKYGHVTYFWNGNRSGKFDEGSEHYVEVLSDVVPFEQRPWMKSAEITDAMIKGLTEGQPKFARCNYANGDMVGHTGVFDAARIGVEAVDLALGRLLPVIKKLGGIALITADHGNADEMYEHKKGEVKVENGKPKSKTAHTLNPVPFIIYDPSYDGEYELKAVDGAGLSNVAATAMTLLGYEPPTDYDESLVALK